MADEDPIIDGRHLSSFKVAELRDELESRGLNTKGVKAVLQERLREAINNPPVVEENPIVAEYRAKQKIALAAQIAADPRKKLQKEEESTQELNEDEKTDEPGTDCNVEVPIEAAEETNVSENVTKEAETVEAASDSSSSGSSSSSSQNSRESSKEPETPEKANDEITKHEEKIDEKPVDESEDTKEESPNFKETETAPNTITVEASKDDDADELDYGDEEEKDIREENGDNTEEHEDVKKNDVDAEKKEKVHRGVAERRRASSPSSRHPVSDILHIRGLVRPFTDRMLREKIASHGGEIVDFWMDKIKSHCFVKMSSKENAKAVREAMNNTKWPDSNPKVLAIVFDEEERMNNYKEGKGEVEIPKIVTIGTLTGGTRSERVLSSSSATSSGKANLKLTLENTVRENTKRENELKEKRSSLAGRLIRVGEKKDDGEHKDDRKRNRSETPPHSRIRLNEEKRKREVTPEKVITPDDLFKKTKALPSIYYLPLTDEQVASKVSKKAESQHTRDKSRDRQRRH